MKALPIPQANFDRLSIAKRAEMLITRRKYAGKLEPLTADSLPREKINQILAQGQAAELKILKRRTPEMSRAQSALEETFQHRSENRRKAHQILATAGMAFTPTHIWVDPFMIWASPSNMLADSRIEPSNSWAKIRFAASESSFAGFALGVPYLTFYFLWSNPSAYYAVVNARCSLMFRGRCQAVGNTGFVLGGSGSLNGHASLRPVEWWNQPPSILQGESTTFMDLNARGGGFWSLSTGNVDYKDQFDPVDLRYDLFAIPPNGVVVFRVDVGLGYSIVDGEIAADFSTLDSDSICCSALDLELLTAPFSAATPGVL